MTPVEPGPAPDLAAAAIAAADTAEVEDILHRMQHDGTASVSWYAAAGVRIHVFDIRGMTVRSTVSRADAARRWAALAAPSVALARTAILAALRDAEPARRPATLAWAARALGGWWRRMPPFQSAAWNVEVHACGVSAVGSGEEGVTASWMDAAARQMEAA